MRPGKMIREVVCTFFKKPATNRYPYEKLDLPDNFRGELKFDSAKCVGCRLCMKDCPTGALVIEKVADKQFKAVLELGKCIYCAQCVDSCLKKALKMTCNVELAQLDPAKLKVVSGGDDKKDPAKPAP